MRMLGYAERDWCPCCRTTPGPDCPSKARSRRTARKAEKVVWCREADQARTTRNRLTHGKGKDMYFAAEVKLRGGKFQPIRPVIPGMTMEMCMSRLGDLDRPLEPGLVVAIWEADEAQPIDEKPDMLVTRHPSGFILTLHDEHLAECLPLG